MKTSWVILMMFVSGLSYAEGPAQSEVKTKISEVQAWAADPVVVDAVVEENNKNKSLDQIKMMDRRWKDSTRVTKMIRPFLANKCAVQLRKIKAEAGDVEDIFVMDNQGAIVCETDMTSDYWQGDEEKFQKVFNGKFGTVFVDGPKFDESTQAEIIQISVPVLSKSSDSVVGVMTVGINNKTLR